MSHSSRDPLQILRAENRFPVEGDVAQHDEGGGREVKVVRCVREDQRRESLKIRLFCGLRNLTLGDQEKNCSIAKYYPHQESQLISEIKSENVKVKSDSER